MTTPLMIAAAQAQSTANNGFERQPSTCLAIARSLQPEIPKITYVSFAGGGLVTNTALKVSEVEISYKGHSTYLIRTASGVTIATDYSSWSSVTAPPVVVTMNHAHSSHYTLTPDPAIKHVLHGWGDGSTPAAHHLTVDDVLIRNVTTDIMNFGYEKDGNSIFIFEVAGLCIGHLGHLHHTLTDEHYGKIGRLDVVMVPVDGAMTLSLGGMRDIVKRLRSSVVLPMHVRGFATVPDFIAMLGEGFASEFRKENTLVLSLNSLPSRPTVIVLPGL